MLIWGLGGSDPGEYDAGVWEGQTPVGVWEGQTPVNMMQ